MAQKLNSIADVQKYAAGVLQRAEHHATEVRHVSMALLGYVLAVADGDSMRVMERNGETKNVCWFRVNGLRYALSYNHQGGTVELREGSTQGAVLASLNQSSTMGDVANAIRYRTWAVP